jgi:hypothetical protein
MAEGTFRQPAASRMARLRLTTDARLGPNRCCPACGTMPANISMATSQISWLLGQVTTSPGLATADMDITAVPCPILISCIFSN